MKTDYEAMWYELCEEINALYNGYKSAEKHSHTPMCEYLMGCNFGVELCAGLVNKIESKHQPKQYSWSEVISMNPLPKKIKNEFGTVYVYSSGDRNYGMMCKYGTFYPSIKEMKNKWIVVEE